MIKNVFALFFFALTSTFTYAASINTACSNGALSFDITVSDGEVCSGNQKIVKNGNETNEFFAVNMSEAREISLNSGDTVSSRIVLECSNASGGSSTISASQSTSSGCSSNGQSPQVTPEIPEFTLPEFNRSELPKFTQPEFPAFRF